MSIRKALIATTVGLFLAQAATAQVFVIGGGLGGDCFQQTQLKYGSFTRADKTCTRALREEAMTRDNLAATYVNRGVLRMRNGRYDSALADYAKAIDLKPQLGAAYLNEGAARIYKKDFASAIAPLDRAIALKSDDIFAAYYNRAIARENIGDVPGAYDDFRKALELKPGWELVESQLSRFVVQPAEG
ncbi:MAG: tetratricopeptide repeat protein [Henriciella sp.]|nr:tetratricopeptide repeat protein [Henriciella sp.]